MVQVLEDYQNHRITHHSQLPAPRHGSFCCFLRCLDATFVEAMDHVDATFVDRSNTEKLK